MLNSEVQHQFWVTKKVVERKFGTKEDECIVSSDAELDAKIELFKTISDSCIRLHRAIDQYQERLCILAQEENALGKFLKETGKNSNTSGKVMICTGKSISYCGQQRMTIRPPLLRLFHEVETFRGRAVADTQATIMSMEKERTEYRAALSWMKSASNQLDPDTGRGLDKFRKAQSHVRLSKVKFDRLSLDCLQKIDLLAAARCNMFSHALVAYMTTLMNFAAKSSETYNATAQALSTNIQYNFCVLKDLTADSVQQEIENESELQNVAPIDSDQMLFFLDEYKDAQPKEKCPESAQIKQAVQQSEDSEEVLIEITPDENIKIIQQTTDLLQGINPTTNTNSDQSIRKEEIKRLLYLSGDFDESTTSTTSAFMPSQLLDEISATETIDSSVFKYQTNKSDSFSRIMNINKEEESSSAECNKSRNSILDFFNRPNTSKTSNKLEENHGKFIKNNNSSKFKQLNCKKDMSAWFDLFAELDPLANPDMITNKLGNCKNNSQAA